MQIVDHLLHHAVHVSLLLLPVHVFHIPINRTHAYVYISDWVCISFQWNLTPYLTKIVTVSSIILFKNGALSYIRHDNRSDHRYVPTILQCINRRVIRHRVISMVHTIISCL